MKKLHVPEFSTYEEAAFWDNLDTADFMEDDGQWFRFKNAIIRALKYFTNGDLSENARNLLEPLGYQSERTIDLEPNTAEGFIEAFDSKHNLNPDKALTADWLSIDRLFPTHGR